jgi:hypothetical protein
MSFKSKPGLSDYDRAKKFGISKSFIQKLLGNARINSYQTIKHPNRSKKQDSIAKKRAKLLLKNVLTKFQGWILQDDETFVKLDFNQLPGQKFFIFKTRGTVAEKCNAKSRKNMLKKLWFGKNFVVVASGLDHWWLRIRLLAIYASPNVLRNVLFLSLGPTNSHLCFRMTFQAVTIKKDFGMPRK